MFMGDHIIDNTHSSKVDHLVDTACLGNTLLWVSLFGGGVGGGLFNSCMIALHAYS